MFKLSTVSTTARNTIFFFFFNDTPTPEFSSLPLHAPLPIAPDVDHRRVEQPELALEVRHYGPSRLYFRSRARSRSCGSPYTVRSSAPVMVWPASMALTIRSEEHTSELQSQSNLVCRLLLETK